MTRKKKLYQNPYQKWTFGEIFFTIAALFLLLLLLKSPILASEAVTKALLQCATLLIPSLFPIMVASEIAVECGAVERITRPLNSFASRILGVKKEAVAPYFLGLLGGYTTSVNGTLLLYKSGKISKDDCERIIALSSLPSLSFLTGFVGMGIFKNTTVGWILWAIAVLSTLILGLITQNRVKIDNLKCKQEKEDLQNINIDFEKNFNKKSGRLSPSRIIVGAISHSASAMLVICACVVFFSTLIAVLHYPFDSFKLPEEMQNLLLGALEITSGISNCAQLTPVDIRAAVCGLFIGWSGLSVHFQIISLCDGYDLSFKKYFVFKAIQGLICCFLSLIAFKF